MKSGCIVFVLLSFIIFDLNAQNVFSRKNLANASQEELDNYLSVAKVNKKTGIFLTVAGPVIFAVTFGLVEYEIINDLDLLGFLFLTGIVTSIIGLPVLIINSSRMKRINKIKGSVSDGIFLDMSPYSYQDKLTHSHSFGIKLRLRF